MKPRSPYALARIRVRLKQYEAAAKLGIGQNRLSEFETGRAKPKADLLMRMADIYECTLDELLGRDGHRKAGFVVTVTEEGTYVVASMTEPYFCFEAATEAEAIGLAQRALAFWNASKGHLPILK